MFQSLNTIEQIAVLFVVIGSIVDVVQFSWILKRAVARFKTDYEKRLIKRLKAQGRLETDSSDLAPFLIGPTHTPDDQEQGESGQA